MPRVAHIVGNGDMAVLNEKYGIEDDSTVIKHNNYHNAAGGSAVGKT